MIICLGTTPAVQRTMSFASLRIDDVNRATAVRQFASGKSVNAARVLHSMGEKVLATGIIGGDSGKFMRGDLAAAGVGHDFVESPTPTRLCLTLVDEGGRTATELIEESADPEPEAFILLIAKLYRLLRTAQVLVLSGTLAPGAGDDFYERCVQLARNAQVLSVVDARGEPLRQALEARPNVVKVNRAELASTLGVAIDADEALRDAMRAAVRLGADWVVVTDGANETWVSEGQDFWRITPPRIEVVNPIGSGDAFSAGVAAGLGRGMDVPGACGLGTACAAANAMTADAGHVRRDDVERLVLEVDVSAGV